MFKSWTHLNRSCRQTLPNNPPIRFMLSFMGQGQWGKLATFACQKRISENPNWLSYAIQAVRDFRKFLDVGFGSILKFGINSKQPPIFYNGKIIDTH